MRRARCDRLSCGFPFHATLGSGSSSGATGSERVGTVRTVWHAPSLYRGGRRRHRSRSAGRAAQAGGRQEGPQPRSGFSADPALAQGDELHRRSCRPRDRALRHAFLDRAVSRVLSWHRRRIRARRHAARHLDRHRRVGIEYRRCGAGIARWPRSPGDRGDVVHVREQRHRRVLVDPALCRGRALSALYHGDPGRFGRPSPPRRREVRRCTAWNERALDPAGGPVFQPRKCRTLGRRSGPGRPSTVAAQPTTSVRRPNNAKT